MFHNVPLTLIRNFQYFANHFNYPHRRASMRKYYLLYSVLFLFLMVLPLNSQTFDAEWACQYATTDNNTNGTGYNTISVAAVADNDFVALVRRGSNLTNYLVGYKSADSTSGRQGSVPYAQADRQTRWDNFFDFVLMDQALDLAAHNNYVFVANNDADHNILVFEFKDDSVYSAPMRMATGTDLPLWAIDVDNNGKVYVTQGGDSTSAGKVLIYDSPDNDDTWGNGHNGTPYLTIEIPENGTLRGVAANGDGSMVYVSNFVTREVYLYELNQDQQYERSTTFSFMLDEEFTTDNGTFTPGPWGLKYMNDKNLLFVACDADFELGDGYSYGKMKIIHPQTGAELDEIDVAQWNFDITGAYNNRPNQIGIASGYTSTYNVDVDENYNVYSQSYFGWTAEKWAYSGDLPVIDIGTSVETSSTGIPEDFTLSQNYPNPFNPTTTINFNLNNDASVKLSVYNIAGELVKTVLNDNLTAGSYKINFDASELSSGTYIYSLTADNKRITKKMTLIK